MKTQFIQYPKCSTCRKAKKWLDDHQVDYQDRHIVEATPSMQELTEFYHKSNLPLKKFFNTSGMVYREMQLKDKLPSMSDEDQLKLLASNGMLIKRPILVTSSKVLVGFKESDWADELK